MPACYKDYIIKQMKKYFYILLIPLLLVIGSCKKELISTRIEGQLLGLTEGKPIADADVYISKSKELPLGGGTIITSAGQTKTDSKGKFEFKIRQEKGWIYKVFARKKDYFDEETTRGVQSYLYLESMLSLFKKKVKLYLHEPTVVDLKLINISNFKETNQIYFNGLIDIDGNLISRNCSNEVIIVKAKVQANREFETNWYIIDSAGEIKSGKLIIPKLSTSEKPLIEIRY
jgi:hypothetical protein